MARVHRTDFAGTTRGVEKTSTGGLRVAAAVTRTGVLRYADASGRQWAEYRPPDEVFAPESLATLRACPVTDLHPPELVTPETWQAHAKGHVDSPPERDGDFVVTDLAVQAAPLCALVESGERRECSSGYTCDVDATPGVSPEGERYDGVQRGIRYNHVALGPVGWGRAGNDVALRMDGAAVQVLAAGAAAEGTTMKSLKIGKRTFRFDGDDKDKQVEMAQDAVNEMEGSPSPEVEKKDADLAEMSAKLKAAEDALKGALAEIAGLNAKLAAETAATVTEEEVPAEVADSIVKKRLALCDEARRVVGDSVDVVSLSPRKLREAVVAKAFPAIKLDGLSDGVLEGAYLTAVSAHAGRNEGLAAAHRAAAGTTTSRTDGRDAPDPGTPEGLRARMDGAWRRPLSLTANPTPTPRTEG